MPPAPPPSPVHRTPARSASRVPRCARGGVPPPLTPRLTPGHSVPAMAAPPEAHRDSTPNHEISSRTSRNAQTPPPDGRSATREPCKPPGERSRISKHRRDAFTPRRCSLRSGLASRYDSSRGIDRQSIPRCGVFQAPSVPNTRDAREPLAARPQPPTVNMGWATEQLSPTVRNWWTPVSLMESPPLSVGGSATTDDTAQAPTLTRDAHDSPPDARTIASTAARIAGWSEDHRSTTSCNSGDSAQGTDRSTDRRSDAPATS